MTCLEMRITPPPPPFPNVGEVGWAGRRRLSIRNTYRNSRNTHSNRAHVAHSDEASAVACTLIQVFGSGIPSRPGQPSNPTELSTSWPPQGFGKIEYTCHGSRMHGASPMRFANFTPILFNLYLPNFPEVDYVMNPEQALI